MSFFKIGAGTSFSIAIISFILKNNFFTYNLFLTSVVYFSCVAFFIFIFLSKIFDYTIQPIRETKAIVHKIHRITLRIFPLVTFLLPNGKKIKISGYGSRDNYKEGDDVILNTKVRILFLLKR